MNWRRYLIILAAAGSLSSCLFDLKYTVGGNLAGLEGSGLVLENNSGDALTFTADGAFTFSTSIAKGGTYSVTVTTQPSNPAQTCVVHNGTGTMGSTDVVNVVVNCTQAGRFAYVANQAANTVSGYAIDAGNGFLTPLTDSPFALNGTSPQAAVVEPNGAYLYVVNNGSNDVSVFAINYASGTLTAAGVAILAGNAPSAIAIDPSNRYLYVTNSTDNTVSAYTLSNGTATPISGSPYPVGQKPYSVQTDPGGNYLYVANYTDGTVSAFVIDPASGALTTMAGSPFGAGAGAIALAIDPTGTFAFVANETAATISSYSITADAGTLVPLTGSPQATGSSPESLVVNPGGSFLYAANVTGVNDVAAYTITPSTGALTLGTPVGAGTLPISAAMDAAGTFVYVANDTSDDVSVFAVNAATGALTQVAGSPFAAGAGARAIAID